METARAAPRVATLTEAVPPSQRRTSLDVLRGFALVGVLLVNVRDFASVPEPDVLHRGARTFIDIVASGKFATLFQLLFGVGFAIQMSRWSIGGAAFVFRYLRRSAALWLIGWAAIVFTGGGSTLQHYAVASVGLLLFRAFKPRALLLMFVVLFALAGSGLDTLAAQKLRAWRAGDGPAATEVVAQQTADEERLRELGRSIRTTRESGSYLEHARAWWRVTAERFPAPILVPESVSLGTLAIFVLGLLLWRSGVLSDPLAHERLFRTAVWAALPLGLAAQAAVRPTEAAREEWAPGAVVERLVAFGDAGSVLLLSLGYAAAVVLLMEGHKPRWLAVLRHQGRIGLTAFVLQWLAVRLIFSGTGFGLGYGGKLGYAWSIPITLVLTAASIVIARWWLAHFRFGPLEGLWRLLTYGPGYADSSRKTA